MNDLTINLMGFPAVNRDLTVELRDPVTSAVVREVKPFLDGTVRVPKLDAGAYEMTVRHPNLTLPILRRLPVPTAGSQRSSLCPRSCVQPSLARSPGP